MYYILLFGIGLHILELWLDISFFDYLKKLDWEDD